MTEKQALEILNRDYREAHRRARRTAYIAAIVTVALATANAVLVVALLLTWYFQ